MPKAPSSYPASELCDMRLPEAALFFRQSQIPKLTSLPSLGAINVTAWLYLDDNGAKQVIVNPNLTIKQLKEEFPPKDEEDEYLSNVGIHSECRAAEFFRTRPKLKVIQIFTERIPCKTSCAPLLRTYFPYVPWFYYYNRNSWCSPGGGLVRTAAQVLRSAYGL
jgi:hypothetical protein